MVIGDIELFRVRTKPILDIVICLQNASQRQFSVFAIKFSCAKNASLNTCKKYRSDIFCKIIKQTNFYLVMVGLLQIIISGSNYFFLQESVLTIKMLHHLFVDLVSNIAFMHHYNILHTVYAVSHYIMIA